MTPVPKKFQASILIPALPARLLCTAARPRAASLNPHINIKIGSYGPPSSSCIAPDHCSHQPSPSPTRLSFHRRALDYLHPGSSHAVPFPSSTCICVCFSLNAPRPTVFLL